MTQSQALEIMKTGANVFLTGEPGSGKTHTINAYVSYLKEHGVAPAITASTGIAATHIGGMTIHSWSGIGISETLTSFDLERISTKRKLINRFLKTDVLIIDEISMLSANVLSMVDQVCRTFKANQEPFGGIQVIAVGDFFQLPPVTKNGNETENGERFAFHSPSWAAARFVACYLTEQHRQDDNTYLSILNAIRCNNFSEDHFEHIQTRLVESSAPMEIPRLFSHNETVDRLNESRLQRLPGEVHVFTMTHYGRKPIVEMLKNGCLSPETLKLKVGAAVMFTKNNPAAGYFNGTVGHINEFDDDGLPIVETHDGKKIHVSTAEWKYEDGKVRAGISQLPLRLAWAITIHKSQGMSMDAAAIDLSSVFEYGQGYVALSRVRRLSGLHLFGLSRLAFEVHPEILDIDAKFRASSEAAERRLGSFSTEDIRKRHELFLNRIGGNIDAKYVSEEGKLDTYSQTLMLLNQGATLSEIATARNLTEGTIIGHIEKLVGRGRISIEQLGFLLTDELREALPVIYNEFQQSPDAKLAPIFMKLGTKYSFNQLRIARIFYTLNKRFRARPL